MKALTYVIVALAAGVTGFVVYRFASVPTAPQPSAAETPAPLSSAPEVLPDFALADMEGTPRSIRSWPDKSMIVNFWATWCAPCRREIPLLNELQRTHGAEGFQVVGVAVDVREDVLAYAQEIGIDYPIIMGEQDALEAANQFGLGSIGFPFTVFTDNQHRIVLTHLGELHPPQVEIILDVIQRVNSGELTPQTGRTKAAMQLEKLRSPDA